MNITPNRRIFINIIATYGRSIFALGCGLITARWLLEALGEVDYGLLGLIGGLTAFVGFFNRILSGGLGRFFALSIGESQKDKEQGLKKCQEWFNTALLIHSTIPLILLLIGYPIGEYAVRNWLTIPLDRIEPSVWVWRFASISCFLGMVTVPFNGFYYAKQYIAEVTIYSMVSTFINVFYLYYIVSHKGDWLATTSAWQCLLAITPNLILSIRAYIIFEECTIKREYLWSWQRMKELMHYSGWQTFGNFSCIARGQLLAILINKYFGPAINASMAIANNINAKTNIFSGGMIGAFSPAITNAYGAKDFERAKKLAFMTCKFGTLLTLIFALPIALELPKIIELWLKTPPPYTVGLCWCILLATVIDQMATGHMMMVNASGKVALYQAVLGSILILTFPIAWLFIVCGLGVYSVGYALVLAILLCANGRVIFAKYLVQMSIRHWAFKVIVPLVSLVIIAGGIGLLPRIFMEATLERILVTLIATELSLCLLIWFILLNIEERDILTEKLKTLKQKFVK